MSSRPFSILAWNILHGGGARRTPGIVLALLDRNPDVILLSEFRPRMGGQIAGVLFDHGWKFQARTSPESDANGLLVAAREPLTTLEWNCPEPRRGLCVRLEGIGLTVTSVHIPDARASDAAALARKSAFWHALLDHADAARGDPHVLVGDFNTGRHRLDEQGSTFTSTALLGRLTAMGYRDAYRIVHPEGRDFSWKSGLGGRFRLDHAYVSRALHDTVAGVRYCHEERKSRLSDHAPMCLQLGIPGKNPHEITFDTQKTGQFDLPGR